MSIGRTRYNPRVVQFRNQAGLQAEMAAIGAPQANIDALLAKAQSYLVRLDRLPLPVAHRLREAFLAGGGDVVMAPEAYSAPDVGHLPDEGFTTDALLIGTWGQYQAAWQRLRAQPAEDVRRLADELAGTLQAYRNGPPPPMRIGTTNFTWGSKTYIMGILNITPDSFSGDGLGSDVQAAVQQARAFVDAGADILDIGGESTRPGAEPISAEVEIARVLPVVQAVAAETDVPISIDTYKAEVAAVALDAGAHMVNDVWGLRMDPALAPLVAERGVPVIIMHNRSRPKNAVQEQRLGGRYIGIEYENLMGDILRELRESMAIALEAGVDEHRIIVDPGIGFGKTVEQNLMLLDEIDQLRSLGRPILVGPSRKSFIGYTLNAPPGERLFGTAATVALAIARGADIVRVHDVRAIADVVRMTDAIVRRE